MTEPKGTITGRLTSPQPPLQRISRKVSPDALAIVRALLAPHTDDVNAVWDPITDQCSCCQRSAAQILLLGHDRKDD